MNAWDLMTKVERMAADTNVWKARRQMAARRAAHVVIVDERDEILGVVSSAVSGGASTARTPTTGASGQ